MIEFLNIYWAETLVIGFIPALIGWVMLVMWRIERKRKRLNNNPHRMTERQYINFNKDRFDK